MGWTSCPLACKTCVANCLWFLRTLCYLLVQSGNLGQPINLTLVWPLWISNWLMTPIPAGTTWTPLINTLMRRSGQRSRRATSRTLYVLSATWKLVHLKFLYSPFFFFLSALCLYTWWIRIVEWSCNVICFLRSQSWRGSLKHMLWRMEKTSL